VLLSAEPLASALPASGHEPTEELVQLSFAAVKELSERELCVRELSSSSARGL
jgi:hypothetical protein